MSPLPMQYSLPYFWIVFSACCALGAVLFAAMAIRSASLLRRERLRAQALQERLAQLQSSEEEHRRALAQELVWETVSLTNIMDEARRKAIGFLQEKKHRLSIALPCETLWLHADAARLCKALSSLLEYAAHACPGPSGLALHASQEAEGIRLDVGTDAVEAAPENAPAYARILLELHGGRMQRAAGGCQFSVWLPLADAGRVADAPARRATA